VERRSLVSLLHSVHFWVAQVLVVAIFLLHQLDAGELGLPSFTPIPHVAFDGVFAIPVLYAALNFGLTGSVLTAAFVTAMMALDMATDLHSMSSLNFWSHTVILAVLDFAAVVVGYAMDVERKARLDAELATTRSRTAEERWDALFNASHAPTVIVDGSGIVQLANESARELLGPALDDSRETALESLVVPVADSRAGTDLVTARARPGESLLRPLATDLVDTGGQSITQIVYVDVTEAESRRSRSQRYAANVVAAQEQERRRISQEIHDEPLQRLVVLCQEIGRFSEHCPSGEDELLRIRRIGEETAAELRSIARGLRPPVLDELGLAAMLSELATANNHDGRRGPSVSLDVRGEERRLPPSVEIALFRISQESLSNALRHGSASRIDISLEFGLDQVALVVSDDGKGFDTAATQADADGSHLGLIGMVERAELLHGTCDIASVPGKGTEVTAVIPVKRSR
jgi:signal transduction histidine kinase